MSNLKLMLPLGWEKLSSADEEVVLCTMGGSKMICAKVRLATFCGDLADLHVHFKERVSSDALIVDESRSSFIFRNAAWAFDSYVCVDTAEKYRSYCYAVIDNMCLVFELMTDDDQSVLMFPNEVKRLISSVDYSVISSSNCIVVGGGVLRVKTPSLYRYSSSSSDSLVLFLGENGYVFVNIEVKPESSLETLVTTQIEEASIGINRCNAVFDLSGCSNGVEWSRYRIMSGNRIVGTGTYFRQATDYGDVVSFLYENGSNFKDVTNFLEFKSEVV